jgi:hypothetical protein
VNEDPKTIAERMLSMYGRSKYPREQRASDHAFSYDSTEPGRKFWIEVLDHMNKLKETK